MSIRERVEEWLLDRMNARRRGSFVVEAQIDRGEERRVAFLGPSGEDLIDAGWPPPAAMDDSERPSSTLGPLP